jgi:hypothetical protein
MHPDAAPDKEADPLAPRTVRMVRRLDAPPPRVYRAWTLPPVHDQRATKLRRYDHLEAPPLDAFQKIVKLTRGLTPQSDHSSGLPHVRETLPDLTSGSRPALSSRTRPKLGARVTQAHTGIVSGSVPLAPTTYATA